MRWAHADRPTPFDDMTVSAEANEPEIRKGVGASHSGHDADHPRFDRQFADTFAQTLASGLFAARVHTPLSALVARGVAPVYGKCCPDVK
jgi:hypothetical protein